MAGHVRIILQARTTSSRLPAKVLLPIGGLPLAVLCAKRLANRGHEVVLATSDEASDDALAGIAAAAGVRVFRGSLNDVLSRFVFCASDLHDEDIVVRATADNPLPDGSFVGRLVDALSASGQAYLGTSSPADGLPYGVSAEAFRVAALRAAGASMLPVDREHVTYSLRLQSGAEGQVKQGFFLATDFSHKRATVDTLQDYLAMVDVFRNVATPLEMPWYQPLEVLPQPQAETLFVSSDKIEAAGAAVMLGTVQLGLPYGIANRIGRPSQAQMQDLMSTALRGGVTWLDTARAYGDAEQRLGSLGLPARVRIVTKLTPLSGMSDTATCQEIEQAVDSSVFASCAALGRAHLDVLMLHRPGDMLRWQGRVIDRLQAFVEAGRVGEIGVSVYTPEEAVRCLGESRITQLQIPFNLLDARWLAEPVQAAFASRPGIRVHVRSVFLQGLLTNDADIWPDWVENREQLVADIRDLCAGMQRTNAADLCMAYVRGFPWVSSLVMGVESAAQLEELLQLAAHPPLNDEERLAVQRRFTDVPVRLLNPAEWQQ